MRFFDGGFSPETIFLHGFFGISAEGKPVDTNQELLAVGLANVGTSLFHGFPGSGAIARGALNYSSGVRTPLGGLYTGTFITAVQYGVTIVRDGQDISKRVSVYSILDNRSIRRSVSILIRDILYRYLCYRFCKITVRDTWTLTIY